MGGVSAGPAAEDDIDERKIVSVVFADLTRSTELAARLDPEDLRRLLKQFFDAMLDEIERFGGTVEKYIGDAIVAIFGVPTTHEDDPERAVRAALAMQRRLAALNADLARSADIELQMRVAVNTGDVIAARRTEREALVTGEPLSVAARLQSLARPGAIVVTHRTYRDTEHAIVYQPLGSARVKGIDAPLRIWQATCERRPVGERTLMRTPFVGRAAELQLLHLLLDRTVKDGRPRLAHVVGPPGIGKSRLTREFVGALERRRPDVTIVRGRCLAYGDGLTYWPFAEILKADAQIFDSDSPDVIARKAHARLDRRFRDEPTVGDSTAALLWSIGYRIGAELVAAADAATTKRLVFRAWGAYFRSRAREKPLIVLLEDMHWADPSLLELVEHLSARLAAPVLLISLARQELWDRRPGWGLGERATTIRLSPLSDAESEMLVRGFLGHAEVSPAAIAPILARAEGNPFYAEELVRMLIDDGVLAGAANGWQLVRAMPSSLPDTVQGVIASRIDGLESNEKRAIHDASVVGRIFWQGALERMGNERPGPALDTLIDKALVSERAWGTIEGERELIFNHVLIRDVAYASIPRALLQDAHAHAGAWIEEVTRRRAPEFAEILAHHFELAGDRERTVRYALVAGDRKRRLFAAEEAIRWYDRALGAAADDGEERDRDRAQIALARGAAREQLARFAEAQADYERAAALGRRQGDARLEARALTALVHVHWLEDRYAQGGRILAEALACARSVGARDLEARLLYTAGSFAFGRGEWDASLAYQRQALAVVQPAGDEVGEAFVRHGLVDALTFKGCFGESLQHAQRGSELARAHGMQPVLYENEVIRGVVLLYVGRRADAAAALDEAVRGAHQLGDRRNEAPALAHRSLLRLSHGDLGGALGDAEAAVRAIEDVESPRMQLTCRTYLMDVLAALGMYERLRAEVRRGLALSDRVGGRWFRSRVLAYKAWLLVRDGSLKAAEAAFAKARTIADHSVLDAMLCAQTELLAWQQSGAAEPSRRAAQRLRELSLAESRPFLAWGEHGIAAAAELVEDWDLALAAGERALARSVEVDEALVAWRSLALLARALDAVGRPREGQVCRINADERLERMAATIPDPERRDAFLAYARREHPARRAVRA